MEPQGKIDVCQVMGASLSTSSNATGDESLASMKILMNNAQICAATTSNKTESKNNNSQDNSQESQKTETESPNNNSQENQKTASPTAATRSKTPPNDTKDHQGDDVRAYTTYHDTEIYFNLHTASVITVTGMYINDDVYHREEGDQKGFHS